MCQVTLYILPTRYNNWSHKFHHLYVYSKYCNQARKENQKLLKEKNFIERLDSVKKLINIWSSRGLSIYGKVTIIKSFPIPKFVYVCSVLPTPKKLIQELNKVLFKFLWKGTDKVKRVSVINEYEEGGLRMIDLECMVKSLRLAWLRRIFNEINGPWKSFLQHLLRPFRWFLFLGLQ